MALGPLAQLGRAVDS